MNIDSIGKGIVIDHITAGNAMKIYSSLGLEHIDASVAIIMKVKSKKQGVKDIIKIDREVAINLDVVGFIDPNVTVSIIENGVPVEKKKLKLPKKITNIVKCNNPRCITSVDDTIDQVFVLTNEDDATYRCVYCDVKNKR